MDWVWKTGVRAMGIYEHEGRPVFVSATGSIEAKGKAVEDIVQIDKYRSIVEQTFEIMARMQLDPRTDYMLNDEKTILYIRLNLVYDKYTKYRKDFAIPGEVLPYAQFKKQLMYSDVFLQANVQKKFGTQNTKCWTIDYVTLGSHCDVSGFDSTDLVPLT